MKKISKVDTRLQRTGYGASALFLGIPFALIGTYFALAGFGVLKLPSKANAPLWVIGVIGISFALAGLTLMVHGARGWWHRRQAEALLQRHAHEPWMVDYPWDSTGISDGIAGTWANGIIGLILMGSIIAPFNWWAFLSGDGKLPVKLGTGLFDLIFVLVFLTMCYRLLRTMKYRHSRIAFGHFPFAPGELLQVGFSPNNFSKLNATLRYIEERYVTTGSGRNRSTHHQCFELFSETIELEPDIDRPEVSIELKLPDDLELVTRLTADPAIRYWELLIESNQPGIDFRTTFPLPVYHRPGPPMAAAAMRAAVGRGGRRSIPYAFEIGLPLALITLAGAGWFLFPETRASLVEKVSNKARKLQLSSKMRPIENLDAGSLMDLATDNSGQAWAVGKYGVFSLEGGEPRPVLDRAVYKQAFAHKLNALASLHVDSSGDVWVGSWYGELFRSSSGDWQELSSREAPLDSRIQAIDELAGDIYLATRDGLWRWSAQSSGLERVDGLPQRSSGALLREELPDGSNRLCAGFGSELWCSREKQQPSADWSLIWEGTATIQTLALRPGGGWLIGSDDGLFTLDSRAELIATELEGVDVRDLVFSTGEQILLVATWEHGLLIRRAESWQTVATENISAIAVDDTEVLWIASYSKGLIGIGLSELLMMPLEEIEAQPPAERVQAGRQSRGISGLGIFSVEVAEGAQLAAGGSIEIERLTVDALPLTEPRS